MKYLQTDLFCNFNCIGGKCIDTCCTGWNILIDKDTYQKYEKLEDDIRQWICSNMEQCESNDYKISMDESGRCPFLNEKNLCKIILEKSEEYLSEVCQTYPRKVTTYYDTEFCTVSTSCPEVARQIVERKTPMKLMRGEDYKPAKESDNPYLFDALMKGYFTSMEILQDKSLSLREKYLILLLLVEEIQVTIEKKELEKIKQITEKYKRKKYRNSILKSLDHIFSMQLNQENTVSLLLNILLESEIEEKVWLYTNTIEVLNALDTSTYSNWKKIYKKVEIKQEKENLAVQFLFEYFMDALNKKSLYNNLAKIYVMMVYIEIFETYLYNKQGELTIEDRTKILYEISRIMEHTVILDCIADELMEENRTLNLIRLLGCIL